MLTDQHQLKAIQNVITMEKLTSAANILTRFLFIFKRKIILL